MASFSIKPWLAAFRLRTLPLALASIFMGSFMAASKGAFQISVLILAALTTIFLQILSNLANDYGDSIHGADHAGRKGPSRAVQAGLISRNAMRNAIWLFAALSLLSGLALLWVALGTALYIFLLFLALGIMAIVAAVSYTAGARPYGYAGLGDVSVLLFFGWIGVTGTFFLHSGYFLPELLLPASSCGLFAVAVLNVNNIRDIDSDRQAGKRSIPVRIGRKNAVLYHWGLLALGFGCAVMYVLLHYHSAMQWLFLLGSPLLLINARAVYRFREPQELDPYLKQMALTALQFAILFGAGHIIS
jgi:1,4-dihydroxy-2-naphthoate octaprenyltransferase